MKPLSIELSLELKKLGFNDFVNYYWVKEPEYGWTFRSALLIHDLGRLSRNEVEWAPSPTVEEVIEQLPDEYKGGHLWIEYDEKQKMWFAWFWDQHDKDHAEIGEHGQTLIEAVSKLWITWKKNGRSDVESEPLR